MKNLLHNEETDNEHASEFMNNSVISLCNKFYVVIEGIQSTIKGNEPELRKSNMINQIKQK